MPDMKLGLMRGVVVKKFIPNAQECEDCNAVNDLERPVCDNCGGTNLRPIESKPKVQQRPADDPKIRRAG